MSGSEALLDVETGGQLHANASVIHRAIMTTSEMDNKHNYDSLRKRFWVQVAMTATVTTFCITMIATEGHEGVYLPILTGLMGFWLPAPDSRIRRSVSHHE
jgi:hypothetical protein